MAIFSARSENHANEIGYIPGELLVVGPLWKSVFTARVSFPAHLPFPPVLNHQRLPSQRVLTVCRASAPGPNAVLQSPTLEGLQTWRRSNSGGHPSHGARREDRHGVLVMGLVKTLMEVKEPFVMEPIVGGRSN